MELLRRTEPLRQIADRIGLPNLRTETRQAGVNETVRLSIYYHDDRSPASVATLKRGLGANCLLTVVHDQYNMAGKPYQYDWTIPLERYQKLLLALRQTQFDKLDDQPDLPLMGVDLWWVERGAGTFYHDVVCAPQQATDVHLAVIEAMETHLPEALRTLNV